MNESTPDKITAKILSCLENESAFRRNSKFIIDRVAYSDNTVVVTTTNFVKKVIKDKGAEPAKKFLSLLLLKECMDTKSPVIVAYVQKKLLSRLVAIAKGERGNIFNAKADPQVVNKFIQLLMECIAEWSSVYGLDPNNKSITPYRKAYQEIMAKGIKFPTAKMFYKDPQQNQQSSPPQNNNKSQNQKPQQNTNNQNQRSPSLDNPRKPNNPTTNKDKDNQIANKNKPAGNKNNNALVKAMMDIINQIAEYKDFLKNSLTENDRPDNDIIKIAMDELIQGRKMLENSTQEMFQQGESQDEELINKILSETSLLGQIVTSYSSFQRNKNYQSFKSSVLKTLQTHQEQMKETPQGPSMNRNNSNKISASDQQQSSKQRQIEEVKQSPQEKIERKPSRQSQPPPEMENFGQRKQAKPNNLQPPSGPNNFGFGSDNFGFQNQPLPNNFPPGPNNFPPGPNNFPSGQNNFPPGPNNFPQGPNNFPPEQDNFGFNNPSGSNDFSQPGFGFNNPPGNNNFQQDNFGFQQPQGNNNFPQDNFGFQQPPGSNEVRQKPNNFGSQNLQDFNNFGPQNNFKQSQSLGQNNLEFGSNNGIPNETNRSGSELHPQSKEDFNNFHFGFQSAPNPQLGSKNQNTGGDNFNPFNAPENQQPKFNENNFHDGFAAEQNRSMRQDPNESSRANRDRDGTAKFGFDFNKPAEPEIVRKSSEPGNFKSLWGDQGTAIASNVEIKGFGFDDFEDAKKDNNQENLSIERPKTGFDFDYENNPTNNDRNPKSNNVKHQESINIFEVPEIKNIDPPKILNPSTTFGLEENNNKPEEKPARKKMENRTESFGGFNFDFGGSEIPRQEENNLPNFFGPEVVDKPSPPIKGNSNAIQDIFFLEQNNQNKVNNNKNLNQAPSEFFSNTNNNIQNEMTQIFEAQDHLQKYPKPNDLRPKQMKDITQDKNLSITSINQGLRGSMIRYDEMECERLRKERDILINDIEQQKRFINQMKIEYDHMRREYDIVLLENTKLKNDLAETKRISNENIYNKEQLALENDNIRRSRDALSKEIENIKKHLDDITKENYLLKEKLIENNNMELKHKNDARIQELEKVLQLLKDKIKLGEEQNKLLTQTYNQHIEEITSTRYNTMKEATNVIIEKLHTSLNAYIQTNNTKLDDTILSNLSPSKSLLNAMLNETKRNFKDELLDNSRNQNLTMDNNRSIYRDNEKILTSAGSPRHESKIELVNRLNPYAETDKLTPMFKEFEPSIKFNTAASSIDPNVFITGSSNNRLEQVRTPKNFKESRVLSKSIDLIFDSDNSHKPSIFQETPKLSTNFITKHNPIIKDPLIDTKRELENDFQVTFFAQNNNDVKRDKTLPIHDEFRSANDILEKAKKLRSQAESHLNTKLKFSTQAVLDLDFKKLSNEDQYIDNRINDSNIRLESKTLEPTEKLVVREKSFESSMIMPEKILSNSDYNSINSKNYQQPTNSSLAFPNISSSYGRQGGLQSLSTNFPIQLNKQKDLTMEDTKYQNSLSKPTNEINRNNNILFTNPNFKDDDSESDKIESVRRFKSSNEVGDSLNTSINNLFKKFNPTVTKQYAASSTIQQYKGSNSDENNIYLPKADSISNEIAKSTSISSQIKEYDAETALKFGLNHIQERSPYRLEEPSRGFRTNFDEVRLDSKPKNIKYERTINYDTSMFSRLPIENKDIDSFKYACLVNKSALFDNTILQIGMIGRLETSSNAMDKSFRLSLHYGNKTSDEITSFSVFCNPILQLLMHPELSQENIAPKFQLKQDFLLNFRDCPRDAFASATISFMHRDQSYKIGIALPITINKFMEFRFLDKISYKNKWRQAKNNIIRIKDRKVNIKFLKVESDLNKYFNNCILDITNNHKPNKKKYGGVFELPDKQEYLIKFILYSPECEVKVTTINGNNDYCYSVSQILTFLLTV